MKRWDIRWRLTAWYALAVVFILIAFDAAMLIMLRSHLYDRDDRVMIEELRELIEEFGRYSNQEVLVNQLKQRFDIHSHYYFQVLGANREVVFQSRFLTNLKLPAPERPELMRGRVFQDIYLNDARHYRYLMEATRDSNGRPLLVQVLTSRVALDREFHSYVWISLVLLPISGIFIGISAFLLAKWALDPVDQIIKTAERISADELSERLQIANPHDELGRLAATLNRMFDRLHHSIDEMRRFTADAAHELRSPLAVMRTKAEVMLRNARSPTAYQRALKTNLEETKRLSDLVDQLLTLSRHDAGLPFEMQDDVQVDALINDVADRLRIVASEKHVELEVACDSCCVVHGDDVAISQLLFNLIDNAIKYTPRAGFVRVVATMGRDQVCISVEDTGCGVSAEHLPHLFDRFYRTDYSRNREFGGAGLGLAICKAITEAHRGKISVTSKVARGSCFTVTLPCSVEMSRCRVSEIKDV